LWRERGRAQEKSQERSVLGNKNTISLNEMLLETVKRLLFLEWENGLFVKKRMYYQPWGRRGRHRP